MSKSISVTEMQRRLRSVFDDVVKRRIPYVLTRGNRPEAVLIPYDQYLQLVQADEASVVKRFEALLARMNAVNAHYSDAEIEKDLQAATKVLRARKRR